MAKFKFKLQSFLGVKEKIEDQKKNEYGKALNILKQEEDKKNMLLKQHLDTLNEMRNKIATGINPMQLQQYNNFISYILDEIDRQEIVIEKARNMAEKKRQELVEAMKNRKMLETLKEHKYEEYMKEEKKADQKIIDEIVSFKYSK